MTSLAIRRNLLISTIGDLFQLLVYRDSCMECAVVTYADEVIAELRKLMAISTAPGSAPHHEARILDMRTDGPDTVLVVYEHLRYPGRFALRRNVTFGATVDREDAAESANMVHIELDEPPPSSFHDIDNEGVRWWGDRTPAR